MYKRQIVRDAAEFKAALDDAFKWENELVIEEFVQGREFSVGVIEGKALPIIEIAPKEGFYDYKNKYKAGSTVAVSYTHLDVYKRQLYGTRQQAASHGAR